MDHSGVPMVALARQNYGGQWVVLGETFLAKASDVSDLEGIRPPLARRVPVLAGVVPRYAPSADTGNEEDTEKRTQVVSAPVQMPQRAPTISIPASKKQQHVKGRR